MTAPFGSTALSPASWARTNLLLARPAEVLRIALGLGATLALAGLGLLAFSLSSLGGTVTCGGTGCPALGGILVSAAVGSLLGSALGLGLSVRYLSRRRRIELLWPSLNVLLVGLVTVTLLPEPAGSNLQIGLVGLTVASSTLFLARHQQAFLRLAVSAECADLGTFGFGWDAGQGEHNPIARLTLIALSPTVAPSGPASDAVAAVAALVLIGAKLALIGFLVWASPRLGRYRKGVLLAGTAVGAIGALSNVVFRLA